ncbi:MAG TPA: nucleotidyltransferase domain-containing protein [Candidatus Thermoplasmatota archaeon]
MRFHGLAEGLLSSAGRVAVINALLRGHAEAWTGSALAREAGVTPRWAIDTLRSLEAEGVVHGEWSPPSWRWTLNRDHVLVKLLGHVAHLDQEARGALRDELRRAVAPLRPVAAVWYGSTAGATGAPGSDVDLLVVVEGRRQQVAAEEALARAGGPFYRRFGNRLAPVVLTRSQFERRQRKGFVREALDRGIWVGGRRAHG